MLALLRPWLAPRTRSVRRRRSKRLQLEALEARAVPATAGAGVLDPSFLKNGVALVHSPAITPGATLSDVIPLPGGKILVSGTYPVYTPPGSYPQLDLLVARLHADGSLDTSFATTGFIAGTQELAEPSLAVFPDGKFLVADTFSGPSNTIESRLLRFNADGSPDTTFGGGTGMITVSVGATASSSVTINQLLIDPSDRILVGGNFGGNPVPNASGTAFLARYKTDGSPDLSFGGQGTVTSPTAVNNSPQIASVAMLASGQILATVQEHGATPAVDLLRYTAAGNLDTTFGTKGIATEPGYLTAQGPLFVASGNLVLAAASATTNDIALFRFTPGGILDSTFGAGGIVATGIAAPGGLNGFAQQANGSLVVLTAADSVLRFQANGTLDTTFGQDGVTALTGSINAVGLALASNDKILLPGQGPALARVLVDDNPVPMNEEATVAPGSSIVLDVLAGDVSASGHSQPFLVGMPRVAHGAVVLRGTTYVYTPASNYLGPDRLTYAIQDAQGGSATGSVELHVAFQVTNTQDSGPGSLRQAILDVNALPVTYEAINFAIPTSDPGHDSTTGVYTIHVLSPLPVITNTVLINGRSEPGYAGAPLIELDGTPSGAASAGLVLTAGSSKVLGLAVHSFGGGAILVRNLGNDMLMGNYIGTTATGGQAAAGNGLTGILDLAPNNTISNNVISGNTYGVWLDGSGAQGTWMFGNRIGTNAAATAKIGNTTYGIRVDSGAAFNRIGGPGPHNVLSGNGKGGICLSGSGIFNEVSNNLIGVGATLGNLSYGVVVSGAGDDGIGANSIKNNGVAGIFITGGSLRTQILKNTLEGNGAYGIEINGAANTTIGTPGPDPTLLGPLHGNGNLISRNGIAGVYLTGSNTFGTLLQSNLIGSDATGTTTLPNGQYGVDIDNSPNNLIGQPGGGNLISSNPVNIYLSGTGATGNQILGNLVGTNATGDAGLTLVKTDGIDLANDANNNIIGSAIAPNVISGNRFYGLYLNTAHDNLIVGNIIGLNRTATGNFPKYSVAIELFTAVNNTFTVNIVYGSDVIGVQDGSNGNTFTSNTISSLFGITVSHSSNNTFGGTTPGTGNSITSKYLTGIEIDYGNGNAIEGNSISSHDEPIGLFRANNDVRAPVLTGASSAGRVTGTLSGSASTQYRIEFFASAAADQSARYLTFLLVTTDGSGNASFTANGISGLLSGQFVTATATDPNNDTSELSNSVVVA